MLRRPYRFLWPLAILCVPAYSIFLGFASTGLAADPDRKPVPDVRSPLEPAESLQHFQIAAGLKIEVAAAEPEVIDPVSIAFDERGRLWAVEMTDYPNGPSPGAPPKSRIRVLEDRDGDGRYETAHVFADKLLFATGVQPWRGGAIVTLAGEVAWFKDSTGDGVADLRETWFRGFAQDNPQLRANHPRWALDNHVYIANGLRGGKIVPAREKWGKELETVTLSNVDFQFDPLTGKCNTASGAGQFGMTFDNFGNRFFCSNRNPCRHVVLDDRYIKRNPFLAVRDIAADVSPAAADSHVYPLSRAWTTSTLHAGQFTAACGVTMYRGNALPPEFRGNSFTCEPTGNLVHRDIVDRKGATFSSHYATTPGEFLATPDEWFRPVDLADGPDGALYVVDMYRAVIEHPDWVPDELKRRPDLNDGNDRGRIYRIVASETRGPQKPAVRVSELTTEGLVALLGTGNSWQRTTAARLLYEQQDGAAVPPLRACLSQQKAPEENVAVQRVHALWSLAGLESLREADVLVGLDDPDPRVREQAVVLSERWVQSSPVVQTRLLALAQDSDPRLRFQVALSLGMLPPGSAVTEALAAIAVRDAGDEWTRRAVLSSVPEQAAQLLTAILRTVSSTASPNESSDLPVLVREVAELIGSRQQPGEIAEALTQLFGDPEKTRQIDTLPGKLLLSGMNGVGQGLTRRGKSLAAVVEGTPELKARLQRLFADSAQRAGTTELDSAARIAALGTLQYADFNTAGDVLLRLAVSDTLQEIRLKAIDVVAAMNDARIGPTLLEQFPVQTPPVRRSLLQALLRTPDRTRLVLDDIAAGKIAVSELDPLFVRTLANHQDQTIRTRAQELLAAALPAERKQVLETYQAALSLKAEPQRGRAIFEKNCANCHKIGTIGVDVGPDIADSRTKTPAQLLTDILNPNQAIDNNFMSYTVVTQDGKTATGVIAAETASSITLRQPENKTVIILRQDIEELRSNKISLMPEGLEKNVTVEQMADLVSFIKNWRYLDGRVPTSPASTPSK